MKDIKLFMLHRLGWDWKDKEKFWSRLNKDDNDAEFTLKWEEVTRADSNGYVNASNRGMGR